MLRKNHTLYFIMSLHVLFSVSETSHSALVGKGCPWGLQWGPIDERSRRKCWCESKRTPVARRRFRRQKWVTQCLTRGSPGLVRMRCFTHKIVYIGGVMKIRKSQKLQHSDVTCRKTLRPDKGHPKDVHLGTPGLGTQFKLSLYSLMGGFLLTCL